MRIRQVGLHRSIDEEKTAARRYEARAKIAAAAGDHKLAALYREIAGEEIGHAHEFIKAL